MKTVQHILLVMAVFMSLVLTLSPLQGERGGAGGVSYISSASAAHLPHSADGNIHADPADRHGGLDACAMRFIDCVPSVPAIANDGQHMNWAAAMAAVQWHGNSLGVGLLPLPLVPPPETI